MALDKIYYLNVGPHGTFKKSGNPDFDSVPQDVDNIIAYFKTHQITNITLYFHGGLVNEYSGMDRAIRITHLISTATKSHPIAFVWETGALETITANLAQIHHTEFFKNILRKIIAFATKRWGISEADSRGEGISEDKIKDELNRLTPFDDLLLKPQDEFSRTVDIDSLDGNFETEVTRDIEFDDVFQESLAAEIANPESLVDKTKVADSDDEAQRGLISGAKIAAAVVKIIYRVIKRKIKQHDHGFYPTVVEETLRELYVGKVGAYVWGEMKDKAKEMWDADEAGASDSDKHVGSYLINAFEKYSNDIKQKISLNLVGHSAGSIVISNLVKSLKPLQESGLVVPNILFMAPAVTCKLFNETIITRKDRFTFFRLFTMSDAYEIKDRMIPIIYPRSLLYFISGLLEGDTDDELILGLQRHIVGNKPYDVEDGKAVADFLQLDQNTCIYAVTDGNALDGLRSLAIKHGDFDNDSDGALASMIHILNK